MDIEQKGKALKETPNPSNTEFDPSKDFSEIPLPEKASVSQKDSSSKDSSANLYDLQPDEALKLTGAIPKRRSIKSCETTEEATTESPDFGQPLVIDANLPHCEGGTSFRSQEIWGQFQEVIQTKTHTRSFSATDHLERSASCSPMHSPSSQNNSNSDPEMSSISSRYIRPKRTLGNLSSGTVSSSDSELQFSYDSNLSESACSTSKEIKLGVALKRMLQKKRFKYIKKSLSKGQTTQPNRSDLDSPEFSEERSQSRASSLESYGDLVAERSDQNQSDQDSDNNSRFNLESSESLDPASGISSCNASTISSLELQFQRQLTPDIKHVEESRSEMNIALHMQVGKNLKIEEPEGAVGFQAYEQSEGAVGFQAYEHPEGAVGFQADEQSEGAVGFQAYEHPEGAVGFQADEQPEGAVGFQACEQPEEAAGFQTHEQPEGAVGFQAHEQLEGAVGFQAYEQAERVVGFQAHEQPKGEAFHPSFSSRSSRLESSVRRLLAASRILREEPKENILMSGRAHELDYFCPPGCKCDENCHCPPNVICQSDCCCSFKRS